MSVSVTQTTTPNFGSMVQAEFYKMLRQRGIMVTGIIILGFYLLYQLRYGIILSAINSAAQGGNGSGVTTAIPAGYIPYNLMALFMGDIRGFSGIFITVATVITIALEYQQGTIRVLLARGVGRLRLLGAKFAAVMLMGGIMVVAMLALMPLQLILTTQLALGNTSSLGTLPDYFWNDALVYALGSVVNLAGTMALAAVFAVLGRSLAFGLGLTLPFFFVEGIITGICTVIGIDNKNEGWLWAPQYFLGTNLTNLASEIIPHRSVNISTVLSGGAGGALGLPNVDATHALVVLGIYVAAFLVFTGWLMQKRDVLQ